MSKPNLPVVGSTIRIFGEESTVMFVEPASDWFWYVEAKTPTGGAVSVKVPTDYRTTDGVYYRDL